MEPYNTTLKYYSFQKVFFMSKVNISFAKTGSSYYKVSDICVKH